MMATSSTNPIGTFVGVNEPGNVHNGRRGQIVQWVDSEYWTVRVYLEKGETTTNFKHTSLTTIPADWVRDTSHYVEREQLMRLFKAPDLSRPVANRLLLANYHIKPSSDLVTSWWGAEVFKCMMKRLFQQIKDNASSRRGLRSMWNFYSQLQKMHPGNIDDKSWGCGVVFSDGSKSMQSSSMLNSGPGSMWWPVLYVADLWCESKCSCWCQAQAIEGCRPWTTSMDRVLRLRRATLAAVLQESTASSPTSIPYDFITTTTVTIEELEPDHESEPEWDVIEDF
jgi:hypothetical protein